MKLTFLGTCAHVFSPRFQTDLIDRFDNDTRRSSALLLGESLLIDCGEHILDEFRISGKDISKITDIFNTHQHADHFNAEHLATIAKKSKGGVRLWVKEGTKIPDIPRVEAIHMTPFERYEVKAGVFLTGVPANHERSVNPQHFIIEAEGKKLFYGCDGGWLINDTYKYIRKALFDLMVLDCTVGDYVGDFRLSEHNSIPMIRLMLPSFKTTGIITDDTRIFLSHIAPPLHASHAETEKIARDMGCILAYDGLVTEI